MNSLPKTCSLRATSSATFEQVSWACVIDSHCHLVNPTSPPVPYASPRNPALEERLVGAAMFQEEERCLGPVPSEGRLRHLG